MKGFRQERCWIETTSSSSERHLDGELTPAEEGRLKSLLAGSGEARTLVAALRSLDEGDREAAIPPADAVPQIMARVRQLPRPQQAGLLSRVRTNAARAMAALMETSGLATGTGSRMEDVMSSRAKIVFGISAAAVVLLIGVYMMGFYPPVDEGAATIGAAKRYQAPQIAAKDVSRRRHRGAGVHAERDVRPPPEGPERAEGCWRTPRCRRCSANAQIARGARRSRSSPRRCRQIASDATLAQIFADAELSAALGKADVAAALADAEMQAALADDAVEAALGDADIRAAFSRRAARRRLCRRKPDGGASRSRHVQTALEVAGVPRRPRARRMSFARQVQRDAELKAAIARTPTCRRRSARRAFEAALADADMQAALAQP